MRIGCLRIGAVSAALLAGAVAAPASNGGGGLQTAATGFFHFGNIDGVDRAIDPEGRAMTLAGVDFVNPDVFYSTFLGYAPYARFVATNYPSREAWARQTASRLREWGFNMLASHCATELFPGFPHADTLNLNNPFAKSKDPEWRISENTDAPSTGFPNVFHPDYEKEVFAAAAKRCAPLKDDPSLVGWFIDNELCWWGRGTDPGTGLFDLVAKLPPEHSARKALDEFIAARSTMEYKCLEDSVSFVAENNLRVSASLREVPREAKVGFLRLLAERYFSINCAAIRAADPNHAVLGCRFARGTLWTHDVVWEEAGKYCDAVSLNFYPWCDLDRGVVLTDQGGIPIQGELRRVHALCLRPLLITEWSFPALDAGRPCLHGAGQRFHTQAERAAAVALYLRTLLAEPFVAGYNWFMWVDQPATGLRPALPEDSNYGLVNEEDKPYALVTEAFARIHCGIAALRAEPEAEASGTEPASPSFSERGSVPGTSAPGGEAGTVPGTSAPGGEAGSVPGASAPGGEAGSVPGALSPGGEAGSVPGTSAPGGEAGSVPGTSSPGGEAGSVPGTSSPGGEAGSVPGASAPGGEVGFVPGASSPGGEAGSVPGASSPGGEAGSEPGASSPGGEAGSVPGASAPGGEAGFVPGASSPGGEAGSVPGASAPGGEAGSVPGTSAPGGEAGSEPGASAPGGEAGSVPGASAPGEVCFHRAPDGAWSLSNGLVRLSGRIGGAFMADEIAFCPVAGAADSACLPAGRFRTLLQLCDGTARRWIEADRVTDVSFVLDETSGIGTVTIRAVGGAADASREVADAARRDGSPHPLVERKPRFAMTARLSLAPGRAEVLAEIVSAENLGDAPLRVERVFMRPYAAAAKPEGVPTVPKLWKGPHEGWWRLPDGRRFGAVSHDAASCSFRFYVSGGGVQHPDAPFVEDGPFAIASGATWRPSSPMGALLKCQ